STSCAMTTSRLVRCRRAPSSTTVMGVSSASSSNVARFFEPRGRPRGLPLFPFLKRVAVGGFLYPTLWSPVRPDGTAVLYARHRSSSHKARNGYPLFGQGCPPQIRRHHYRKTHVLSN